MERRLHTEHWQDDFGRAKDLGVVWVLYKRGRTARCVLQGHPVGTEARILIDDDVLSTKAFKDSRTLVDETWEWRKAFEAKGWQPT